MSQAMIQFDVHVNPVAHVRGAYPYVAVLQSPHVPPDGYCVVAPLASLANRTVPAGRLAPRIAIAGADHALIVPRLGAVRVRDLRAAQANIADHRDAILAAIDYLFVGF